MPIMSLALHHLDNLFSYYDTALVITDTYRNKKSPHYKPWSLHNIGLAVDIRKNIDHAKFVEIKKKFNNLLNDDRFQFIEYNDHYHLEYDRRYSHEAQEKQFKKFIQENSR